MSTRLQAQHLIFGTTSKGYEASHSKDITQSVRQLTNTIVSPRTTKTLFVSQSIMDSPTLTQYAPAAKQAQQPPSTKPPLTNGTSYPPQQPTQNGTTNGDNHHNDNEQTLKTPDSADRLIAELSTHKTNTLPLWSQMTRLNPPQPTPQCTPHLWSYSQIRPYLLRAGTLITEKQAERRVLMLINPARNEAPYTTDTIYGGLQLVMPDETAPAHRHVAFAMRFIVEGEGGFTAVHGERVNMRRGDVILTPVWNWHDHGNGGDVSLMSSFGSLFLALSTALSFLQMILFALPRMCLPRPNRDSSYSDISHTNILTHRNR